MHRSAPCLCGFAADRRGISAVEFALIAPILLMLVMGVAELGRYGMFRLKLSNASYTIADLTARAELVSAAEIETIMATAATSLEPFNAPDRVRFLTSAVAHTRNGQAPSVVWQVSSGDMISEPSRVGSVGEDADMPADLVGDEMGTAIVSEILVRYDPWLLEFVLDHVAYESMAMRPRRAALATLR